MNIVWMLGMAAAIARGQTLPAEVRFTHYGPVSINAVRLGDECYVPFNGLFQVGFNATLAGTLAKIDAGTGKLDVPIRMVNGREMVPLRRIAIDLGGDAEWDKESPNTLNIRGRVASVKMKDGKMTIEGKLMMRPTVTMLEDPKRVVFDFKGYTLDEQAELQLAPEAKVSQYRPDTVRVVVPVTAFPDLPNRIGPSGKFELYFRMPSGLPTVPVKQEESKPIKNPSTKEQVGDPASFGGFGSNSNTSGGSKQGEQGQPANPSQNPAQDPNKAPDTASTLGAIAKNTGPLLVQNDTATTTLVGMQFDNPVQPYLRRISANQIELVLLQSDIKLPEGFSLDSKTITSFELKKEAGASVIALTLARPMGAQLSAASNGFTLRLIKPNVGDGKLAGKIIYVDAGHGGKDVGCHTGDMSVLEKDLTLQIARQVMQQLSKEGASVVMTRNSDVYIPVDTRPKLANQGGADLFLSIHINSHAVNRSVSGSIVFYHFKRPLEETLALSISDAIKQTPMQGSKASKDNGRFVTGYGVLKYAQMPSVLIETGFLSTARDRQLMIDPDFQFVFARAIVKGLKDYLGNGN